MNNTFDISRPNTSTIVKLIRDGEVKEMYVLNNAKDVQVGSNCLVIDGLENSSGAIKIPFVFVVDKLGASNAIELLEKYEELGYFTDGSVSGGGGQGGGTASSSNQIKELNELKKVNESLTETMTSGSFISNNNDDSNFLSKIKTAVDLDMIKSVGLIFHGENGSYNGIDAFDGRIYEFKTDLGFLENNDDIVVPTEVSASSGLLGVEILYIGKKNI